MRLSAKHRSYRFRGDALSLAAPPPQPVTTNDERKARARDYLRTLIRTGIKAPPAPAGMIGEIVRTVAPRLNLAQAPIRAHAYRQLRQGVHLLLVLVGVLAAWIIADARVLTLLTTLYFLAAVMLLRPGRLFRLRNEPPQPEDTVESALPNLGQAMVLLALALLAPAGLTYLASDGVATLPGWLDAFDGLALPTLAAVLPALAGSTIYFVALARQTRDLRESNGSHWGSTQPYALPEVSQGLVRHIYERLPAAGTLLSWRFDRREEALYAGFLAEGESKLDVGEEADSLLKAVSDAWASASSRALLLLHGFGLLLGLLACYFAWLAASDGGVATGATALGLAASGHSCMFAALKLWKRADFVSLVYEVDIEATCAEHLPPPGSRIQVRNYHRPLTTGNVRARVLRMRSVQFEPHGQRFVTGIELDLTESMRLAMAVDDYQTQALQNGATCQVQEGRAG